MANMIQNISQKRPNKKITKKDLVNIFCLAWQTVYPGMTMFQQSSGYTFGHVPLMQIHYIKGVGNNKASYIYRAAACSMSNTKPDTLEITLVRKQHSASIVKYLTNTSPSNIYPTLKIDKEGDEKIIIENSLMTHPSLRGGATVKATCGLYLVNPPMTTRGDYFDMFHSIVIFTPKPGLFDEDGPPT